MSIKTLVAGLGACALFLAGLGQSGNADASVTHAFDTKAPLEQTDSQWTREGKSGADLKEGFSNLLLAYQGISSSRLYNKRIKRQYRGTRHQTNRQNDPRFFQRGRRSSFATQGNRSYSNRRRIYNQRSSITGRNNNFRDSLNIHRRSRSR